MNDPVLWDWGGPENAPVHVLILLFAVDFDTLAPLVREVSTGAEAHGLAVVRTLHAHPLAGQREHFGFRDGLTNPTLQIGPTTSRDPSGGRRGRLRVPERGGRACPCAPATRERGEPWGHNGSYLVFRQIEQDVGAFWGNVCARAAEVENLGPVELASKMVGRWPNGVPLAKSPSHPGPSEPVPDTLATISYVREGDAVGLKCPMGSHIRRSNPRDGLGKTPAQSLKQVRSRRILRRGRSYGPPFEGTIVPQEARTRAEFADVAAPEADGRGLYFLGLNANLGTQFEFVQQTSINSHKFNGATDTVGSDCRRSGYPRRNQLVPHPGPARAPSRERLAPPDPRARRRRTFPTGPARDAAAPRPPSRRYLNAPPHRRRTWSPPRPRPRSLARLPGERAL